MSGVDLPAILAFVNARLDEREQRVAAILRRAPHWRVDLGDSEPWETNGVGIVDDHDDAVAVAVGSYAAEFIALNDPAFVLADVAAKRLLLREILSVVVNLDRDRPDDEPEAPLLLRLLAAPFDQHADYDPTWAVEA